MKKGFLSFSAYTFVFLEDSPVMVNWKILCLFVIYVSINYIIFLQFFSLFVFMFYISFSFRLLTLGRLDYELEAKECAAILMFTIRSLCEKIVISV